MNAWQPQFIRRYDGTVSSSTNVLRVSTDAGDAYVKALGNPAGPQVLFCDWFGTWLASFLGLATFDVAILQIDPVDELPFAGGGHAQPGPALAFRAVAGAPFGDGSNLDSIVNIEDVEKLVVFDTWLRNCDRHAPTFGAAGGPRINRDNLFLTSEDCPPDKLRLLVIDHTHILTCGRSLRDRAFNLDRIRDDTV